MQALSSRTAAWRACLLAIGLLAGCGESSAPDDDLTAIRAPEIVQIMPASEALAGAHVPTLDPATMNDAEIEKALGAGPHCEFRYTSEGKPVLAWEASRNSAGKGVVKLNGYLVVLRSAAASDEVVLAAEQVRWSVARDREDRDEGFPNEREGEATAVFEVEGKLKVGYSGYYQCAE